MDEQFNLLDLNTAELNELKNLPGIGRGLAKRILAARPFASYDDLQRVSGFGPALLENLRSYATVIPPADVATPEVVIPPPGGEVPSAPVVITEELTGEAVMPEPLPEAVPLSLATTTCVEASSLPEPTTAPVVELGEPAVPAATTGVAEIEPPGSQPPSPPQAVPRPVDRGQLLTAVVLGGLASTCLAFFCVLFFLGVLNGGYRYSKYSQYRSLSNRVESLQQ